MWVYLVVGSVLMKVFVQLWEKKIITTKIYIGIATLFGSKVSLEQTLEERSSNKIKKNNEKCNKVKDKIIYLPVESERQ